MEKQPKLPLPPVTEAEKYEQAQKDAQLILPFRPIGQLVQKIMKEIKHG